MAALTAIDENNPLSPNPFPKTDQVKRVQQSYGRCLAVRDSFLELFYRTFFDADPEVRDLFARTDMEKQRGVLRTGISNVIMFAEGSKVGELAVRRLVREHDRQHLNIPPRLYPVWRDALIQCVAATDPKFSIELGNAWQIVIDYVLGAFIFAYEHS